MTIKHIKEEDEFNIDGKINQMKFLIFCFNSVILHNINFVKVTSLIDKGPMLRFCLTLS